MNHGKVIGTITRHVVTAVEYGDTVDGKARILGMYATHDEAKEAMCEFAKNYYVDLGLDMISIKGGTASVGSTDECGCEYRIDEVEIPVYLGELEETNGRKY